jgi:hypothetical protein
MRGLLKPPIFDDDRTPKTALATAAPVHRLSDIAAQGGHLFVNYNHQRDDAVDLKFVNRKFHLRRSIERRYQNLPRR